MNRRNVLVIAAWYPTEDEKVAGIFIKEHARASAIHNNVVVLHSLGLSLALKQAFELVDTSSDGIRSIGIRYRKPRIPKTSYIQLLRGVFQAVKVLEKEGFIPDLVHAHVFTAGFIGALLSKAERIPLVISEHYSGFALREVVGVARLKAKLAFRSASVICPVSAALGQSIKNLAPRKRYLTVPNAVDTTIFFPRKQERKPLEHEPVRVLLVALLGPKKGVPNLLEAIQLLNRDSHNATLDIVGDGPHRMEYEGLVTELGLKQVVTFHGMQDREAVAEHMSASDLLVLPSPYETFGCVLIESLACGTPVVAVANGGPQEIVSDNVGRLAQTSSPAHLAEAIQHVIDHLSDYPPLELSVFARRRYSLEVVATQLADAYALALSSGHVRRSK